MSVDDVIAGVAEKFRAEMGEEGVLLKNSTLHGVREVLDRKWEDFAIVSM